MKKGFVYTFISICSGTEVFVELIKNRAFKAFWHLFLLALICSFLNVALKLYPFHKEFEKNCDILQKQFGNIQYTKVGMVPTLEPDKQKTVDFENFTLVYFPKVEMLETFEPSDNYVEGIVWTPQSVQLWKKIESNDYIYVQPLITPTYSEIFETIAKKEKEKKGLPADNIFKKFKINYDLFSINPAKNIGKDSIQFRNFQTNLFVNTFLSIPLCYGIGLFMQMFFNIMVLSLFYIFLFTIFSSLFGKSTLLKLKYSQMLAVNIYISFPGLIIATIYSALMLPFLDFQSIFLIAFFVYSFPVFRRLQLEP